eukprot:COSAG05_NODE_886_length_6751_cov_151.638906_14_plen_73_part_00
MDRLDIEDIGAAAAKTQAKQGPVVTTSTTSANGSVQVTLPPSQISGCTHIGSCCRSTSILRRGSARWSSRSP